MQPLIAEFKKQTGIGIGAVQDISIFDAPQRAMAEALSRSPQFDLIHIDSNMIPSLASAGYLEPLDDYMKKADFKIEAVADYAVFMTYKGQTYLKATWSAANIGTAPPSSTRTRRNQKPWASGFTVSCRARIFPASACIAPSLRRWQRSSSTNTALARRRPSTSRCGSARERTAFRSCPTR